MTDHSRPPAAVGRLGRLLMVGRPRCLVLVATVVAFASAGCQSDQADAEAESPAATAGTPVADATIQRQMELVSELQALDQSLTPVRELALQDPVIQAQEQALIVEVDAVMESVSPGFMEARDRFEVLRAEYGVAEQAGDQVRLQALGSELQGLQVRLGEAQAAAADREDVSEAIETFRQSLFEWMRAKDPAMGPLLDRVSEITDELESMGPPGGA